MRSGATSGLTACGGYEMGRKKSPYVSASKESGGMLFSPALMGGDEGEG